MNAQTAQISDMPVNARSRHKINHFRKFGYIFDSKDNSLFKVIGNFNLEIFHSEDQTQVIIYWGNNTYGYVDRISASVTEFESRATYMYNLITNAEAKF